MSLKIASWNINSVRLRIEQVARVLEEHAPDVICLQETKCLEAQFPLNAFNSRGYVHSALTCQKGYHGVAILSRHPFASMERFRFGGKEDARHIAVTFGPEHGGVTVHNFYVPAGGDIPDPEVNPKFAHKLAYLDEMQSWSGSAPLTRQILVGDLNVAPLPDDVWSHKQMLGVVSHTPAETERMLAIQAAGGWVDAVRTLRPAPERVFTWWSYRSPQWEVSDRGRRLDHVWVSGDLAASIKGIDIRKPSRAWERPSDHVPIIADFEILASSDDNTRVRAKPGQEPGKIRAPQRHAALRRTKARPRHMHEDGAATPRARRVVVPA
jgi:exodeoxyribonuclease III